MREYVQRLLADRYDIVPVADGWKALTAAVTGSGALGSSANAS